MPRTGKAFNIYLPSAVKQQLIRQSIALKRTLHAEILHAIERHLAQPPVLVVPELEEVEQEEPPRGRDRRSAREQGNSKRRYGASSP